MKFRNYCIVVMGLINVDTIKGMITKVSEIKPNVLDAKGILIATFSSMLEPNELKDLFKSNGISFLLFDLDPEVSGVHINKKNIHEGLFGFIETLNDDALKKKAEDFMIDVTSGLDIKNEVNKIKKEVPKKTLKDQLKEALEKEDYAKAASIRDEMKKKK